MQRAIVELPDAYRIPATGIAGALTAAGSIAADWGDRFLNLGSWRGQGRYNQIPYVGTTLRTLNRIGQVDYNVRRAGSLIERYNPTGYSVPKALTLGYTKRAYPRASYRTIDRHKNMPGYKRKRGYKSGDRARKRPFRAGFDRTGGNYYGKFKSQGSIMNVKELKYLDSQFDDSNPPTTGTIKATIIVIPIGNTSVTRVGKQVWIRDLHIFFKVKLPSVTGGGPISGDVYRIIVYIDKQANGATATAADILADQPLVAGSVKYDSWRNLNNGERFTILYDKKRSINYAAIAGLTTDYDAVEITQNFEFHTKLALPVTYSGTAGLIAEIKTNNIGMLYLSNSALPTIQSNIRVRFND